jgi:hypothetical protein
MKVVAQDGTPLPPEHLISSVNLKVEVRGTEAGDTFRLLAIRKLESPPAFLRFPFRGNTPHPPRPLMDGLFSLRFEGVFLSDSGSGDVRDQRNPNAPKEEKAKSEKGCTAHSHAHCGHIRGGQRRRTSQAL